MTTTELKADFYIAQGDTGPSIVATLVDEDGDVIDLTGLVDTDVKFHMIDPSSSTEKVDNNSDTSVLTPKTDGKVQYDWQAGDTDTPGLFDGEFQVNFPGGQIITFPNYRYFTIQIREEVS